MMINPSHVINIPMNKLAAMYKIAWNDCPFWSMFKLSAEKAEKVVYPPQTPVTKKNLKSDEVTCCLSAIPSKIPISKHPVMFVISVAIGKWEGNNFPVHTVFR